MFLFNLLRLDFVYDFLFFDFDNFGISHFIFEKPFFLAAFQFCLQLCLSGIQLSLSKPCSITFGCAYKVFGQFCTTNGFHVKARSAKGIGHCAKFEVGNFECCGRDVANFLDDLLNFRNFFHQLLIFFLGSRHKVHRLLHFRSILFCSLLFFKPDLFRFQ